MTTPPPEKVVQREPTAEMIEAIVKVIYDGAPGCGLGGRPLLKHLAGLYFQAAWDAAPTPSLDVEQEALDIERGIRIAIWNGACWQGSPQEVAQSLIRKVMDEPPMQLALTALRTALSRRPNDAASPVGHDGAKIRSMSDTAWLDGRDVILLACDMLVSARYCAGEWSPETPISAAEYDGAVWSCFDDEFQFEIEETGEDAAEWHHGPVKGWIDEANLRAALSGQQDTPPAELDAVSQEGLRACPKCGRADSLYVEPDERGSGGQWVGPIHVGCTPCELEMVCTQFDTVEEAVEQWNRRQPPAPVSGSATTIEEARKLLQRLEPHLEAIICFASGTEHEPNQLAVDVRAFLAAQSGGMK